jgi:hypothetical protein
MPNMLEMLVIDLQATKLQEEMVRSKRIELEVEVAQLVPGPERGSKTVTLGDGTKVTVERGFNYKADCDAIERDMFNFQPGRPIPIKIKTTRELDVIGYEWFRENAPEGFSVISKHVQVTPKKIAVSIKEKK